MAECLRCAQLAAAPWPERVQAVLSLAELLAASGNIAGARDALLPHLHTAVDPGDPVAQRSQAALENSLGVVCRMLGRLDEAADHYAAALRRLRGLEPGDELASLLHNLAGLCHARDASEEGIDHGRRGLHLRLRLHGDDHELVAADRANLAGLLYDVGRVEEAEAQFEAAIGIFGRRFGDDHPEIAVCLSGLASIHAERGDRSQAERLYRRASGIKAAHWGPDHVDTLITEYNLARLLFEAGRPDEARAIAERVDAGLSSAVAPGHRVLVRNRELLAELG